MGGQRHVVSWSIHLSDFNWHEQSQCSSGLWWSSSLLLPQLLDPMVHHEQRRSQKALHDWIGRYVRLYASVCHLCRRRQPGPWICCSGGSLHLPHFLHPWMAVEYVDLPQRDPTAKASASWRCACGCVPVAVHLRGCP